MRLVVLDVLGRRVKVIFDGKVEDSEAHSVPVRLPGVASGFYMFRLSFQSGVEDKMFLFMR